MTLNLAHYEKVYAKKKTMATDFAEHLIEKLTHRPADMPKAHTSCFKITNMDEPRVWLDDMCKILGCIMFSSGYWFSYKTRTAKYNKVNMSFDVSIMTEVEKTENLEDPGTWGESDDDGYSSDDDEPSPKSEIATPA